jgi:restriction system protein
MSLWLVRGGSKGEYQEFAIDNNVTIIGWRELPDLSGVKSWDELIKIHEKTYPQYSKSSTVNQVGQVWTFINRINIDDYVIMPLKGRSAIAIGKVTGPYTYRTDLPNNIHHLRPVKWIATDIPRTAFEQDLLNSLGAFMTVCQIQKNNAESRIIAILNRHTGLNIQIQNKPTQDKDMVIPDAPVNIDIERAAGDQITEYLSRKYRNHDLARLVNGILQAQGYVTLNSEPGADGGVDILAGGGMMGFTSPRICVQVKSSDSPCDVTVLRSLKGTMDTFKADQGLLVSWGGFTNAVYREAKSDFFKLRLWDSDDLLEAIYKNYESLPSDIQAELPLKKIWSLVPEEE